MALPRRRSPSRFRGVTTVWRKLTVPLQRRETQHSAQRPTTVNHAVSPSADCGLTTQPQSLCSRSLNRAPSRRAIEVDAEAATWRDQVREALLLDLETARCATDGAFCQYDEADPTNLLVAAELETRWNQALTRLVRPVQDCSKGYCGELSAKVGDGLTG
jgi:hypothetical protein